MGQALRCERGLPSSQREPTILRSRWRALCGAAFFALELTAASCGVAKPSQSGGGAGGSGVGGAGGLRATGAGGQGGTIGPGGQGGATGPGGQGGATGPGGQGGATGGTHGQGGASGSGGQIGSGIVLRGQIDTFAPTVSPDGGAATTVAPVLSHATLMMPGSAISCTDAGICLSGRVTP
jgi:hypothetical protein